MDTISSYVGHYPRQLIAILCIDIDDYSGLLGTDEDGERHRREIINPAIANHCGQLIENAGEGFLAIFDGPIEAVRCALGIRQHLARANASLPQQSWIQCRVGIDLGDLSSDSDDICGSVSIATRLHALAEPGALYISGSVYEQVKNKLGCRFQSQGAETFEDVADPVRIYSVLPDSAAAARAARTHWILYGIAMSVGLGAGGAVGWYKLHADRSTEAEEPPAVTLPPARRLPEQNTADLPSELLDPVAPPAKAAASAAVVLPKPPRGLSRTASPYNVFRECERCPEMVELPGSTFLIGSNDDATERPAFRVTVPPFALGRRPVTIGEWKHCVAARACDYEPSGENDMAVHNLSWNDAQQYVTWLSNIAGSRYRLPTEAEWEYAARGGTSTRFWWGDQLVAGMANCKGCSEASDPRQPMRAGSFAPNQFGLYDMGGGVAQWVSDCWHKNYRGAPNDGSAWDAPNCRERVLRGGSWKNDPSYLRASSRDHYDADVRYPTHGLRVARSRSE